MKHLSIRVAWHDNNWNGTVCRNPKANTYCQQLARIFEEKQVSENDLKNKKWNELPADGLPPCKAEGGAFMNEFKYKRLFKHPYINYKKANHSHLLPTEFEVPAFSTFSVPFWWMLNGNQKTIDTQFPGLPYNHKAPFATSWVYERERQEALLNLFYKDIKENQSLILFYTKTGNPIDETTRRLLIGIGSITKLSDILVYETKEEKQTYPLWDRLITHSIRPDILSDSYNGFLLPYKQYLELPDAFELKQGNITKSKKDLMDEIKVSLLETGNDESIVDELSYVSQHVRNETMLSILNILIDVVVKIMEHGIAKGPWKERLKWLNEQVKKVKLEMSPFPSFSSALQAFGFKQANQFYQDLKDLNIASSKSNLWEIFEDVIYGRINKLNNENYASSFPDLKEEWLNTSLKSKELLSLLSRFNLSDKQIKRWYNADNRKKMGVTYSDNEIIENPYLIIEENIKRSNEYEISVENIDNGLFEDKEIQGELVPEKPYKVETKLDKRRIRALIIQLLRNASDDGDTLLSNYEIRQRISKLKLARSVTLPDEYINNNLEYLKEKLTSYSSETLNALQLNIYSKIEDYLRKIFVNRAQKSLASVNEDWEDLILRTIKETEGNFNSTSSRHISALEDQKQALERITSRKLSILDGPAGTGKTCVMGALVRSTKLAENGILLLAPTGKARERLKAMAHDGRNPNQFKSYTIAQFLTKLKRFDWNRMKPKFEGKDRYKAEKTIIIDECSMLTEDDFYGVFLALDLTHVERIILVGDPYQLPPIGAGRPFADLCSYLDELQPDEIDIGKVNASKALSRLEVVVRTNNMEESDVLRLASWFAGRKSNKNNDVIFEKIGDNSKLNDLKLISWDSENSLIEKLHEVLKDEFGLKNENDIEGFNKALGLVNNKFPIENPKVIENFQLLSPVRNPFWGIGNVNRIIQKNYRNRNEAAKWNCLGDQLIHIGDKVMQLVNEERDGYFNKKKIADVQISNGQIGYVCTFYDRFSNICFAGQPNVTFGYSNSDFSEDSGKLELAYAITIHKSQGSDFKKVILILPQKGRILSRELMYTAMTRSKDKLIIMYEGDNLMWLFNYSKGSASETARRNTLLFTNQIRESQADMPWTENLIHRLKNGVFVRSKSEVIIGNLLIDADIKFEYEERFEAKGGWRLPDFTIEDASGDKIILEHLGMLHKPNYKEEWEKKKKFYEDNGFVENVNLFTTTEDENGSIDSYSINSKIIPKIKEKCI